MQSAIEKKQCEPENFCIGITKGMGSNPQIAA